MKKLFLVVCGIACSMVASNSQTILLELAGYYNRLDELQNEQLPEAERVALGEQFTQLYNEALEQNLLSDEIKELHEQSEYIHDQLKNLWSNSPEFFEENNAQYPQIQQLISLWNEAAALERKALGTFLQKGNPL